MRKNVIMTVVGCVKNEGLPEDVVKLFTTGYLSGEDDCWKLKYTETDPETSERSHVTLQMEKNSVSMSRDGFGRTLMQFTPGRRFEGMYQTPFGDMSIGIFPNQVSYRVDSEKGEIDLSYRLDIQGQYSGERELHIRFADKNTEGA